MFACAECLWLFFVFFFFQAEDGIRDVAVTGVQTCALPILTAVYGASSLLTISGGQVGSSFALKQALGAAVGGIVAALLARSDYRKWQRAAWPVLGVVAVLLLLPLLPFTQAIAPSINGARRWVNLRYVSGHAYGHTYIGGGV